MIRTEEDVELMVRGIRVRLSGEHVEVLRRVAAGQTYAEIGRDLGYCRNTIRNRVLDVRNALGVETRIEAVSLLHEVLN